MNRSTGVSRIKSQLQQSVSLGGIMPSSCGFTPCTSRNLQSKVQKRHLSSLAVGALLSPVGLALFSGLAATGAQAGSCTIAAAALTSDQSTVCTGDFSGERYVVSPNVTGVTVTNEGNWVFDGASTGAQPLFGPNPSGSSDFSGSSFVNNGSITWTNVPSAGGSSIYTALGNYARNLTEGGVSVVNNGTVSVTAAANARSTYTVAGGTRDGFLTLGNSGNIIVDYTAATGNGEGVGLAGSSSGGADIWNTGTISIPSTDAYAEGIAYFHSNMGSYSAYRSGSVSVRNDGVVSVSTTGDGYAGGMFLGIYEDSNPTVTDITYVNTGSINVSTADDLGYGIYLDSNVAGVPIVIENSGEWISDGYAVYQNEITDGAPPVYLTNTGTMTGHIRTASGDDQIYFEDGVVTLNIATQILEEAMLETYKGDDLVHASGATVYGLAALGHGDDTFMLSGGSWNGDIEGDYSFDIMGGIPSSAGDDQFLLSGGALNGDVYGDFGNDTIVASGSTVVGDAIMGRGNDFVTLSGGSWTGDIYGDYMTADSTDGDDSFTYSGGVLTGNTYASGGNDMLTASGSAVTGDAALGLGNDSATLSGGSWTGNIYGDGMTADAADGDDAFIWSAGALTGGYYAGGGNDTATVSSSGYDGSQIFSGDDAAGTLAASTYDAITFSGVNATTDAGSRIIYWNEVTLENAALAVTSTAWDIGTAVGEGLFLNNSTLDWTAATGTLNANLDIGAGSTASFGGTSLSVAGNLANNGLLTMQNGAAGSNVVVLGDYAGTGMLAVDVDFATDTSDVLTVNGDVTGGPTLISVNSATTGSATGNDVLVVDVVGASAAGDFALSGGPIGSGAYLYDLFYATGDFYLGTDGTYQPAVPVYEAYPQVLQALGRLPTLRQRVGERDVYDAKAGRVTEGSSGADVDALWTRIDGRHDHFEPKSSTTGYETDFSHWALNLGVDGQFYDGESGQLIGGIYAKYSNGMADTTSVYGNGRTVVDGYGLGATLTWYAENGFYADGQAQFQWYESDLKSDTLGTLASANNGSGFSTSLEVGQSFGLTDRISITPQAQLTYSMVSFDDFAGAAFGENVSLGNDDSLRLRLGISTDEKSVWQDEDGKTRSAGVYAIANVHREFLDGTSVNVSGASLNSDLQGWYGEVGFGGTYAWADGKYAAYGELSGLAGIAETRGNYSIGGKAGLMVRW